jgi:hypothetical protein
MRRREPVGHSYFNTKTNSDLYNLLHRTKQQYGRSCIREFSFFVSFNKLVMINSLD